jgi:hypothetical protein
MRNVTFQPTNNDRLVFVVEVNQQQQKQSTRVWRNDDDVDTPLSSMTFTDTTNNFNLTKNRNTSIMTKRRMTDQQQQHPCNNNMKNYDTVSILLKSITFTSPSFRYFNNHLRSSKVYMHKLLLLLVPILLLLLLPIQPSYGQQQYGMVFFSLLFTVFFLMCHRKKNMRNRSLFL